VPLSVDREALKTTRQCLTELDECWKQWHGQFDAEELGVQWAEVFSHHYDRVLSHMSCWLDDFQLRLVNSQFELDVHKILRDMQV